ncbi:hypothetical protein C8T65DRAFT_696271 [Cerioporus squamosus]|nr:hypothetical protein C8T65DRAFT_696271 [Cerioporus squamosus]
MPAIVRTLLPACFAPMVILVWGFAWFAMSVCIFYLGCFLPALRMKPPPLVQKSRSPSTRPRSPRPLSVDTELLPEQQEDDPPPAVKFGPSLQRAATVAEASRSSSPFKKPTFKKIFSFTPARSTTTPLLHHPQLVSSLRRAATDPETLKSPASKSDKSLSPALRRGRATSSPESFISSESETTLVDHLSPTLEVPTSPILSADGASSASSGAPRSVHLSSMKMFRSLSRRMSFKQKADFASVDEVSEPRVVDEHSQRNNTMSGEVFSSKFVNPFRSKQKSRDRSASSSPAPSSRPSLHLSHGNDSPVSPVPDSPRSSTSSVSTAYSTFSSRSTMSAPSGSPRSVPRTQPYGAPHYAPMPGPRGRPSSRRAASLSLDRPATVAEESGEEAGNALGLELGLTWGRADTVPNPQRKPFLRHRYCCERGRGSC